MPSEALVKHHSSSTCQQMPLTAQIAARTVHLSADSCETSFPPCRIDERIKSEKDPDKKLKLRRFSRGLKNAHEEIARCA